MVSRVSSNHTHDIHWPSTPEKEVNRKETPRERLRNGNRIRQQGQQQILKFTHAQILILAQCYFMA